MRGFMSSSKILHAFEHALLAPELLFNSQNINELGNCCHLYQPKGAQKKKSSVPNQQNQIEWRAEIWDQWGRASQRLTRTGRHSLTLIINGETVDKREQSYLIINVCGAAQNVQLMHCLNVSWNQIGLLPCMSKNNRCLLLFEHQKAPCAVFFVF